MYEQAARDGGTVTDAHMLEYVDRIKLGIRSRMHKSMFTRLMSSTIGKVGDVAATMFGFSTHASTDLVGGLAAIDPLVSGMQGVWKQDHFAKAYAQGLYLIEEAEAAYYKKLVENGGNLNKLTLAGAELYETVNASLKLMGNLIATQLPKMKDMKIANVESKEDKKD